MSMSCYIVVTMTTMTSIDLRTLTYVYIIEHYHYDTISDTIAIAIITTYYC